MINPILAHPDEHLYQIHLKNLEAVHHKITQSIATLSMLSDRVSESSNCTLHIQDKQMAGGVLWSAIDLLKQTITFLREP